MSTTFDDVLEAVEHLPVDQRLELIAVVQRRLAEQGLQRVAADVREGRADFQAGRAAPISVADLMREIES